LYLFPLPELTKMKKGVSIPDRMLALQDKLIEKSPVQSQSPTPAPIQDESIFPHDETEMDKENDKSGNVNISQIILF
jgi:hypothetical protein